jgi:hypothetical protein
MSLVISKDTYTCVSISERDLSDTNVLFKWERASLYGIQGNTLVSDSLRIKTH